VTAVPRPSKSGWQISQNIEKNREQYLIIYFF